MQEIYKEDWMARGLDSSFANSFGGVLTPLTIKPFKMNTNDSRTESSARGKTKPDSDGKHHNRSLEVPIRQQLPHSIENVFCSRSNQEEKEVGSKFIGGCVQTGF